MELNSLPYELKHKISEFLDTKSLLKLIQAGLNELDNNFIWKQKCKKEYSFYSNRINNWKKKYKKLYLKKCIHCYKNTKLFNEFFNIKICRECELNDIKYHTVSFTKAKSFYLLTNSELSKFYFINRVNPYNYKQISKLYLKTDILNYITDTKGKYIKTIQQRIDKRILFNSIRINKFTFIVSTLITVYNVSDINLSYIMSNLNLYTKNLYKKFMRYNNRSILPIINKALELDFIFKYTRILFYNSYNSFEEILYDHMLTSVTPLLPLNINEHINLSIKNFILKYRSAFIRKTEILKLYNLIKHRLTITNILKIRDIQQYIRDGIFNINVYNYFPKHFTLKNYILLYDFLYVNTDIQEYMFQYNLISKSINKYQIYIFTFNKWYICNPTLRYKIPKELYSLLYN